MEASLTPFDPLLPGDNGISQTANRMKYAVRFALENYPAIRARAESLVAACPERDEICEVKQVYAFVLAHYRYLKDPRPFELLKSPEIVDAEISKFGAFQGDCDDVTCYLAALLTAIGFAVNIVVISVRGMGDEYRHVFPRVYVPAISKWVALEATARNHAMGWEPPNGGRIREYPVT